MMLGNPRSLQMQRLICAFLAHQIEFSSFFTRFNKAYLVNYF